MAQSGDKSATTLRLYTRTMIATSTVTLLVALCLLLLTTEASSSVKLPYSASPVPSASAKCQSEDGCSPGKYHSPPPFPWMLLLHLTTIISWGTFPGYKCVDHHCEPVSPLQQTAEKSPIHDHGLEAGTDESLKDCSPVTVNINGAELPGIIINNEKIDPKCNVGGVNPRKEG